MAPSSSSDPVPAPTPRPPQVRPLRVQVQIPPGLLELIDQEVKTKFSCRSEVIRQLVLAQLAHRTDRGPGAAA